jgi:hypothetical protein
MNVDLEICNNCGNLTGHHCSNCIEKIGSSQLEEKIDKIKKILELLIKHTVKHKKWCGSKQHGYFVRSEECDCPLSEFDFEKDKFTSLDNHLEILLANL